MTNDSTAIIREASKSRLSFSWFVPVIAIVITVLLFMQWLANIGPLITVSFEDAGGLTVDSPVMFRGTIVGRVESIELSSDTSRVEVHARLATSATVLAKKNSLWWVVQPSVSLQGVEGLDTIAGPRYIEVLPNGGEPCYSFIGTEKGISFSGKQFTLVSNSADNVTVGAPLYYRGVEVGQVSKLGLSNDSSTVRVTCNVKTKYVPLIRTNTQFWNISGISLDADLLGIDLHAGPLTSWIKGGIAFATPTNPGDEAPEGYAFAIASKVDTDWLDWSPTIELNGGQP